MLGQPGLWGCGAVGPWGSPSHGAVGQPGPWGRGAALGRGTGWGPLETRCSQSALALVMWSPSRRPRHQHRRPAAAVVGRMWPGAGRAASWPGAWWDREAAAGMAGRGCFIGESAGSCGVPRAGDPGEEAEAEGSEPGPRPGWRGWCGAGAWACGTRVGRQLPCGQAGKRRLCLQREERAVSGMGVQVQWRGSCGIPGVGGCPADLSGGASRRRPCRSHSCSTSGSRSSWSPSCTGLCRRPAWGSLD